MRKTLLATTALAAAGAFAAGPVLAADMMSVGVGGYMQQWIGVADRGDEGSEGGVDTQADSEIHFKGSLESDNGLTFTVHVELEGNNEQGVGHAATNPQDDTEIDESFVRISSEFGQLEIGQRDHGMVRMHYGIKDAGVGLNAGDTQKWIPGTYLETSGHVYAGGDDLKLNYFTPRMNGLQVGFSYAPDQGNENAPTLAPNGNDNDAWGIAANYAMDLGDGTVSLSAGHLVVSQSMDEAAMFMTGMAPAGQAAGRHMRLTPNEYAANNKAKAAFNAAVGLMPVAPAKTVTDTPAGDLHALAVMAENDNLAAMDGMTTKIDNKTYTNVGIAVGFGAFSFNVAYATQDGGKYKAMDANRAITAQEAANIPGFTMVNGVIEQAGHTWDHDSNSKTDKVAEDADGTDGAGRSLNDPGNDVWKAQRVAKDGSADFDAWGVSVLYSDGPMAVSLAHMTHSADNGGERSATMLSGSYSLAPGVDWKTSVFGVEDTTSHAGVTDGMNEGTAFVTGITLSF